LTDRGGQTQIPAMERLGEEIWTVPTSLKMPGGVDIGSRMTVMRLGEELALHSPVRVDDALAAEIDALGQVRWLIAPCTYHHLFLKRAKERWPDATILGVPGLEKRTKVAIEGVLPDATPSAWSAGIETHLIGGIPRLNEVAFLHRPSKTLVLTDFVFNMNRIEGWLPRAMLRAADAFPGPRQSRMLRWITKDRAALTASREVLLSWDFERMSVCHFDVVEENAKDTLARSTSWLG
jgi:hypothetical protein